MRGKFYIPDHAHPLVKRLFEEMNIQKPSLQKLGEKSGVNQATIQKWRNKQRATLDNIDAVFGVLGYRLTIERLEGGN